MQDRISFDFPFDMETVLHTYMDKEYTEKKYREKNQFIRNFVEYEITETDFNMNLELESKIPGWVKKISKNAHIINLVQWWDLSSTEKAKGTVEAIGHLPATIKFDVELVPFKNKKGLVDGTEFILNINMTIDAPLLPFLKKKIEKFLMNWIEKDALKECEFTLEYMQHHLH